MKEVFTDQFIENFLNDFGEHSVFLRAWDYDDTNSKAPVQISYEDIDKFNDPSVGGINARYSIFFHPNGDMGKVQSMRNRKNADATMIYCLYADFDLWVNVKKKLKKFPRSDFQLQPTSVVETYNWFHTYWILKEPQPVTMIEERWSKCMDSLATLLWSDPQVKNLARILRLPWCYYWSHKQGVTDNPFKVECIEYNPKNRYELEDFEKIFAISDNVVNETFIPDWTVKETKNNMESSYNEIISSVNPLDVLFDLDNRYWVKQKTHITEDWKTTDWYRYYPQKNALVDFSKKGRAQWTSYSVAKHYKGSDYETFKYFAERWNIGKIYESKVSIVAKEVKKQKEDDDEEQGFQSLVPTIMDLEWGVDITVGTINITISFDDKKVYKMAGNERAEIMDASIKTLWYYSDEDDVNTYIVEYAKANGDTWIIYLSKLWKKAELEKRLSEVWISYFGWNGKVEKALVAYIHSCNTELKLINQLGIYDKKMIVNKYGKYSVENEKGERYFCNINDVQPSDRHSEDIFKIGEKITKDEFLSHVHGLSRVYKDSIIYSLFTHYAMWMFAYSVRQQFSRLPSCSLVWTTSAGKTYARRLIMNMLWMDSCMEIKASTTEFSVLTLCKHNVPLSVWEYSNDELRFDRDPMLKNNYDGTANTRWTSSQKLKIYPNNACFCIDWEVWTMTNSVLTRQIALRFNTTFKRGLADDEQMMNINYYLISNMEKINGLKKVYLEKRRPLLAETFSHINKAEKERILDNYALLLSFADCFEFIDVVKDGIVEQCQTQFDLFGEDMIDKIIKQVFTIAITSRIEVQVINQKLIIELIMDFMRLNKKRFDDLLSSVQSVNYHFMNLHQTDYSWSDRLEIPLEYVLKNKSLHATFNSLLDASAKINLWLPWIEDTGPTVRALREYARANHLEERLFYQRLDAYKNVEHLNPQKSGGAGEI